jgi:hypothetical protein
MKGVFIGVAALLLLPTVAMAQQVKDPKVQTYRELLSEANDRIAALSERLYQAQDALAKAQAEKAKPTPPGKSP